MFARATRRAGLMLGVVAVSVVSAQVSVPPASPGPAAAVVVVPQARVFASHVGQPTVQITHVEAGVVILNQVATTTLDIHLGSTSAGRQEAELLVPVPEGAVVRSFTFEGKAGEPTAQVLPKDEARRTYDSIVARTRDPALLEFLHCNLVRSSVFPVEARGSQKVRLTYEHLLTADGNRIDYVLPRSESLDYCVPWTISVRVKSDKAVSTVYSPSHSLDTKRSAANVLAARVTDDARLQPGPFRLSFLLEQDKVTASLLAYPDPAVGGGYFLLLAGLPAEPEPGDVPAIKREITLVIDRSGSMGGRKMEQARAAALQVLGGLAKGECFRIVSYDDRIEPFSAEALPNTPENARKAAEFVESLTARGGTNIHDALLEALRPAPAEGTLPIVLFLTDGQPTTGNTSEVAIRNVAVQANSHARRIFTFGVGLDVNTPLLEKVAYDTRATPTFVLPQEDVEVKVAGVFKRLTAPVLAGPTLVAVDESGKLDPGRVRDLVPDRLPDLFKGDQLVLLGQYRDGGPLRFDLRGNFRGQARTFRFTFDLAKATTRNAFVPRLWASRRIAVLVDAIRQAGADGMRVASPYSNMAVPTYAGRGEDPMRGGGRLPAIDPRIGELVDEVVRLSKEFGILTEYTAFLAHEGTDLSRPDAVLQEAGRNFQARGMDTRSGLGAVNQSANVSAQMQQKALNMRNEYYDQAMQRVSTSSVQQVSDRAFYNRGGRWVDSRVIDQEATLKPARVIPFGSDEYRDLVRRLLEQGRQGAISLRGDILIEVDGQPVLVKAPPNE